MNEAKEKSKGGFRELRVYQLAYATAMEIFRRSHSFPEEERYSLTSQIRRSSRSVAANIAEGYRKRQYPAMFCSKLADADAEATETDVWLDFARDCGYLSPDLHRQLTAACEEIGRMLHAMIADPEKFAPRGTLGAVSPLHESNAKSSVPTILNRRQSAVGSRQALANGHLSDRTWQGHVNPAVSNSGNEISGRPTANGYLPTLIKGKVS